MFSKPFRMVGGVQEVVDSHLQIIAMKEMLTFFWFPKLIMQKNLIKVASETPNCVKNSAFLPNFVWR